VYWIKNAEHILIIPATIWKYQDAKQKNNFEIEDEKDNSFQVQGKF
jgi:hypothetical protein